MFSIEDGRRLDVLHARVSVLALTRVKIEEEETLHGAVGVIDAVGLDFIEPLVVVVNSGRGECCL